MSVAPGARLGSYEILAPLGAGGMGEVYRARDTELNRDVAIKILPDAFALDTDRVARFQREAQLLATLNHPNIAHIYGIERAGETRALVLELVEGPTLADRIAQGPIPLDEALAIARQIAQALEAAHEQGVIHRDLKPANIKVTSDGVVKVLDFGLAKALDPAGASQATATQSPTLSMQATQAGVILGTAAYMSPEQAKGRAADRRSDIWAFGCVLYEMLTGKRAFEGEDVSDTLAAVLRGEPDWHALPDEVPAHLRLLLRRCLQRDRTTRISDVSIVRFLITEPLVDSTTQVPIAGVPPTAPRPLWKHAVPLIASAIAGGTLVGMAVWSLRPSMPQPTITRFSLALGEGQQFSNTGRRVLAISPDGTHIVYVANQRLYLRSMSDLEARPIPGTENLSGTDPGVGVTSPVFSPDGRSIVFYAISEQALKKISLTGGAALTICPALNPFGMSWEQNTIVFGQGGQGIKRVSANGGTPEVIATVKSNELAHGPQILPGGQGVLFTIATAGGADQWDTARIVVQSLTSDDRKTLIDGASDGRYLPTGHLVYAHEGSLLAVPFDAARLAVTGGPMAIVEGVLRPPSAQTGTAQFSVSTTGSLIYVPGPAFPSASRAQLAWIDRMGAAERLKLPVGSYQYPRLAPDGRRVAYDTDDGKETTVWIYDLSGAMAPRRLTFAGRNRVPVWSPDGERVAFQSDREGDAGIFWQRADGTGAAARLTKPEPGTLHTPESWSSDGKTLLFNVTKGSDMSLWTLSLQDKRVTPFDDVHSVNPTPPTASFSPDGRWVAYDTRLSSGGQIPLFVQPFPPTGAKYQITAGFVLHPLWSPDGKELFFSNPAGQLSVVSVMTQPTFAVSSPTVVPAEVGGGVGGQRNYDIAPDGRRFIAVVAAGASPTGSTAQQIDVVLNWAEELKQRVPSR